MLKITKKVMLILNERQKKMVVVLAFMMLIGGIVDSVSVSLILPLISAIMNEETWNQEWYAQLICKMFHISEAKVYIEVLLILLILFFFMKNVYLLFEYYVQYSFIAKSQYKMRHDLMTGFIYKPYAFFLNANSGEIVRIFTEDTTQAFALLTSLLQFYTEAFVCVILGITIFIISPTIAFELVVILLLELLVIAKFIRPTMKKYGEINRNDGAASNKWILQSIQGIKNIKVAQTEDFFREEYGKHAERVVDATRKNLTLATFPRLFIEAITVSAVLALMFIMVIMGKELTLIVPQLTAFVVAAMRLLPSVNRISVAINQMPYYEGGLDNIINVLKNEKRERDAKKENYKRKNSDRKNIKFRNSITLKSVDFSYVGAESNILDCAGVEILSGQSVGIVGSSGSGKTTVVDIMLGLLKPQSGCVLIDGINIEENLTSWLDRLAYIPQQIFLMDDTIRENVAFGKKKRNIDDEKVWEALKEAQMEKFVKKMPDGLDTVVGEQGIRLSGGERQRIGIARALYNNPDVIFFDEATSALDNETETAIMESINSLKGRKTLVIIAHRLSTISNCDVVYRVQGGKILKESN